MSQELHYTSVARGLKPGSRGFGTVATTANLPETLAERLEGLSAIAPFIRPATRRHRSTRSPTSTSDSRSGNHLLDDLSRIGPAGLDYSGRPNKYAHHILLEPHERPEGGPAWLLSQPGFIQTTWQGEPRILPAGPPVPRGDRPATIARSWLDLTGDAGWAGMLAESFLADPRRPVFLVYRPGVELLPLFVEAIALLPASRRWDVEFSTYLTNLPPGVSCTWRGVLEGSAEAKNARRLPNALILDLGRPAGRAQGGALVHLARTGERLDIPDAASPPSTPRPDLGRSAPKTAGPPPRLRTSAATESPGSRDDNDWLPDLAARLGADESLLGGERLTRPRPRRRKVVTALAIAGCLVPLLAATLYWSPSLRRQLGLEHASSPPSAASPSVRSDAPVRVAVRTEAALPSREPAPSGAPVEPLPAAKTRDDGDGPLVEKKPEAKAAPSPPAPPLILAFAPPEVPRSTLGRAARQSREIRLPQDVADRLAIRNGPEFRLTPLPTPPHSWEIATRTGSGLGGGFPLARLTRVNARTWQFDWTKNAKAQSTQVEGLKDAVLQLDASDGRAIYVLLRGLDLRVDRPIEVWKNQRILFDRLEPRIRSVEWAANPDVLDRTRWKPRNPRLEGRHLPSRR